jgi:methionine salvage enolase-phosphatase E1
LGSINAGAIAFDGALKLRFLAPSFTSSFHFVFEATIPYFIVKLSSIVRKCARAYRSILGGLLRALGFQIRERISNHLIQIDHMDDARL